MFPANNSPFSGLVPVILVLALIGALAALALTGSDLTNFLANREKARAIALKNEYDAEISSIDLKNYKMLKDSQAQAQMDQLRAESAAYIEQLRQKPLLDAQKAAQERETTRQIGYFLGMAGALAIVMIGLGAAIFLAQIGRNAHAGSRINAKPGDPWQDPVWRKQQILLARQIEVLKRGRPVDDTPIPVQIPARKEAAYNQK